MNITGQAMDQLLMSQITAEIGSVRKTMQDPTTFNDENLGTWMLMNGQSCAGTLYATKFTLSNVPDAYTEGAFLRQAKSGRTLGTYEADAFQGHIHTGRVGSSDNWRDGGSYGTPSGSGPMGSPITDGTNGTPRLSNETRPKNIAVNYMIKVDHI